MKKLFGLKAFLPILGFMMSGCEPSGQLLTGGVCTTVVAGAFAIGVSYIVAKFQRRHSEVC